LLERDEGKKPESLLSRFVVDKDAVLDPEDGGSTRIGFELV
jgi:hypothetical protein